MPKTLVVEITNGAMLNVEVADDYKLPDMDQPWFHAKGVDGGEIAVHHKNILSAEVRNK